MTERDNKSLVVLVVIDDDRLAFELVFQILTPLGYEVKGATCAEEGLKLLKEGNISLAIIDLRLPDMNGFELIEKVQKDFPRLPLVVMTAYAREYDLAQAIKLGVVDCLEKPFSADQLISTVTRSISPKEVEKRLHPEVLLREYDSRVEKREPSLPPRLLVVDDDENIRLALHTIMKGEGYNVVTAMNPILAFECLSKQRFDVVISDVKMPGMDGFEFVEKIKQNYVDLPVIMITGHGTEFKSLEAFHKGAWDYIEKPFHPSQVIFSIERALEKRKVDLEKIELIRKLNARMHELKRTLGDLKKAEAQLIQAGKMAALGQLGAGIAHEINQPLTVIKGYAQILLKQKYSKSGFKKDLKCVDHEVDRIASIIRNLRKFAGAEMCEEEFHDVNETVRDALMLCRQGLKNRGIVVREKMDEKLSMYRFKQVDLQQVLMNLINNAIDAIEENHNKKGEIRVETYEKDHAIYISVTDNGVGMTKETQEQIFNPFFTTKGVGRGMGLGLSISYGIVSTLGGRIIVRSKEKKGSQFTIELPLFEEDKKELKRAA